MADELANRLSSLADSLRSRGMPPPQSSVNSEESTSETLQRLFPSTRGRNSWISGLGNQRPVPSEQLQNTRPRLGDINLLQLRAVLIHYQFHYSYCSYWALILASSDAKLFWTLQSLLIFSSRKIPNPLIPGLDFLTQQNAASPGHQHYEHGI